MNDDQLTTKDMFEILRSDISEFKAQVAADIAAVRSDIHGIDDRLRRVEETVAGTKAVATYQKQIVDWLFRIAALIGVGGAVKAFFT